jgi:transcriptional regulator with XRE-family HTH domain
MDLVLKLREIRRLRGLSQKDVARMSGVGEKTISSFETGQRIGSLKLSQLKRMLKVYGMSESEFFGSSVERQIAPWELDSDEHAAARVMDDLRDDRQVPADARDRERTASRERQTPELCPRESRVAHAHVAQLIFVERRPVPRPLLLPT